MEQASLSGKSPAGAADDTVGEVLPVTELWTNSGKHVASFGDSSFPGNKLVIVCTLLPRARYRRALRNPLRRRPPSFIPSASPAEAREPAPC